MSDKYTDTDDAPEDICKSKAHYPMECPEGESDEECDTEISSTDPSRDLEFIRLICIFYLFSSPEKLPNKEKRKGDITNK
jgi:hypothetical protein